MTMRRLSSRTRRVLYAFANGSTIKTASADLGLSPGTVEYHVRRAKSLLGARTLTHSVVLALLTGQLPDKVKTKSRGELPLW